MIAKTLVFVCAAFGLVAGSCFEVVAPQQSSQVITIPAQTESFSSGSSLAELIGSGSSSGNTIELVSGSSSGSSLGSLLGSSLASAFGSSSGSAFGAAASNGPEASPITLVQAPSVTLPAVEGPVVTLSSQPIPAPRVLSQRCICTKTIVKPQVIQRQVTVPRLQRYLKRTVTPVVENVAYKSTPITQGSSSSGSGNIVISGSSSGSSSGSVVLSSGSSASSSPVVFSSGSSSSSVPVVLSSGSSSSSSVPVVLSSGSSCSRVY